jgi:hypothetical protein
MSDHQTLWADFGVVEELTEQAAETISGGAEVFSLYNNTNFSITHLLDGTQFTIEAGDEVVATAYNGGIIVFDTDVRDGYVQAKSYDLADGGVYVFNSNNSTANPYDIDLYKFA